MKVKTFYVIPDLPDKLKPLQDIAYNLWTSWQWESIQIFIRIDPDLWYECSQNPVKLLGKIPPKRLEELANDEGFLAAMKLVNQKLIKYMEAETYFQHTYPEHINMKVAYFSMEYGLHDSLPVYSGGLGVLSGDHMKSASDLGIPLVGIGLLYRQGYFRQYLNADGWQGELYPENDWYNMPVKLVKDKSGKPMLVSLKLYNETVYIQIWKVQVGRIQLFLMDTNIEKNSDKNKTITAQLYGGDTENRIRQEIVLGIGGVRVLRKIGIEPSVFHINEGHSSFLTIERIRQLMKYCNLSFQQAKEMIWATTLFTTHTPVPAGNERFPVELMQKYLGPYISQLNLSIDEFIKIGRENPDNGQEQFGMTVFAINMSAYINGVSKLHAVVSRQLWKNLWVNIPERDIPIGAVTNGIHSYTWLSHEIKDLFKRYLGPKFEEEPQNSDIFNRVDRVPDEEIWSIHERRRERLVFFARRHLEKQLHRRGANPVQIKQAQNALNPNVLTIAFARRFATYKRATLLFKDMDRLIKIITSKECPVQIIFSGKAHPHDNPGKELIKSIIHIARDERLKNRIIFLEDYDVNVARYLVQGADVWLNTPKRFKEASGTSGMKAAVNGVLNVSILDGWWDEAYEPELGWSIGHGEDYEDPEYQDYVESKNLYDILEQEVIPLFYQRGVDGIPYDWISKMKASIVNNGMNFNSSRMLQEYNKEYYLAASNNYFTLKENEFDKVKQLSQYVDFIYKNWNSIEILEIENIEKKEIASGELLNVLARVFLGNIKPGQVSVDLYTGHLNSLNEFENPAAIPMEPTPDTKEGFYTYRVQIPCQTAGRHGYTIRILPKHSLLVHPYILKMSKWE